jgi:GDPmannose 4,6-dehydratase
MWLMLQQPTPDDYVIATNESHTVKDFIERAFAEIGVFIRWEGTGVEEKGYDNSSGALLVQVDPKYFRQTEVDHLRGDYTKAKQVLNWAPSITFKDLVARMVKNDILLQVV